jgi:hypothetical protein
MEANDLSAYPANYYGIESDNTIFTGYGVPNANLIYMNFPTMELLGGVHYAGHIHDPYDTLDTAYDSKPVLVQMAQSALLAATIPEIDFSQLRAQPAPQRRAVIVASHTESPHMSPTTFIDFGMTMAMAGYDLDLIPYSQPVTLDQVQDAALVIVLPVHDYPSPDGDQSLYDQAWDSEEIDALSTYVYNGGLLILTNSAHRLKYGNRALDGNEDWGDQNALAAEFGVLYSTPALSADQALPTGDHALMQNVTSLQMAPENGLSFTYPAGALLAQADAQAAIVLLQIGDQGGEVLALADVGFFGADWVRTPNITFWKNIAEYARNR